MLKKELQKKYDKAIEKLTHFSHCFQGEYIISCKYGNKDNCPAKVIYDSGYNQGSDDTLDEHGEGPSS